MAFLTLAQQVLTPRWSYGGSVAYLRIFASQQTYEATTGELICQGSPTNPQSFCQQYTCTVSGTTVTLPEVTLATTTDSTVPNTTYTAILYDSQNQRRYTMLSQFFVDPQYFQQPAFSSVICTQAGTTSANAVYSYRGQTAGKGYYNIIGYDTSTSNNVIVWVSGAGEWRIKNATGTILYVGTEDTDFPWEVVTWSTASGIAPPPTVAEEASLLISNWESLTLSQGVAVIPPQYQGPFWSAAATKEYINNLVGDGTTPYAAKLIAGKTELSADPLIRTHPIAIGTNDPVWNAINESIYLDIYGYTQADLTAALTAIGSTPTELILTQQCSVTGNTSIPANVLITFQANGSFTVATGITLTIASMSVSPSKQIFYGAGNVVFGANAVPYLDISWWSGPSPHSLPIVSADHAFAQATLSMTAGNGPLEIGVGIWKVTNWKPPNDSVTNGRGSSTNAADGTVLQLQDTSAPGSPRAVVRVGNNFRNVVINDLTISTGASDAASCFIVSGSVPNTGLDLTLNNVTFHGTHDTSPPQFYVFDADGAHAAEFTNIRFQYCQWATPVSTKSIHCDTVNSTFVFVDPQVNNPRNSTFWYGEYGGWVEGVGPASFRGVPGLSPTITADRTIKATITSGTKTATVTSGAVTLNDVGQQVVFDNGIVNFASQITGITSASAFTTAVNASHTFTAADAEISVFSPDTNGAYAVWHLVHAHNTIQIENSVDEGYQYYLVNDASDNNSPFNVNGGIIQSLIRFNNAIVMNVGGVRMNSQLFEDISGTQATINLWGNSRSSTSVWGVTLLEPTPWGINNGTSMIPVNFDYGFNGTSFVPVDKQTFGVPVWFEQDTHHAGNLSTALAMFVAADVTNGGPHKALFGWGRLEPTSEIFDYGYFAKRDYDTGFSVFEGNQALPNRGFEFNASVFADNTFVGGVITANVTTNEDNFTPGGSQMVMRLNPTANRTMGGLGLTGTSLSTMSSGEVHQIWNVSATHTLTLLNQSAGSSAANRFLTDTGQNIVMSPNERCFIAYDGTTQRWRVSKLNVTGLYDSGTQANFSIPVAMTDTLNVLGVFQAEDNAIIAGITTIGVGDDFTFDFEPSSTVTGIATIGNPGSHAIELDEASGIMTFTADDIEVIGPVSIVGHALNSSGGIRESGANGIGYSTGSGGAIGQGTSRVTTVVLNKINGDITLFSAAGSATPFSFSVTNSTCAATDSIIAHQKSGTDKYAVYVTSVGAGSFGLTVVDLTGTTVETPVIHFSVIKSVNT